MRHLYLVAMFLFISITPLSALAANAEGAKLDGKVFTGVVGEKGDKKGDPDNFEFVAGKFHSTACDQYGYTSAPYSANMKNEKATTFSSTTKNEAGDTITWSGVVENDKIKGNAIRKTASGKTFKMWFNGTVKKQVG